MSRTGLYRLTRRFRADGTVTALLPRTAGRPQGLRLLDPKREAVIRRALKEVYLQPTRSPFARLVHEMQVRCLQQSLQPPNWRTIKQRLLEIDLRTRARRRGDAAVLKATEAPPGSYTAARPLEVVQIDHTKVNVIVVDDETGKPCGRPRQRTWPPWPEGEPRSRAARGHGTAAGGARRHQGAVATVRAAT